MRQSDDRRQCGDRCGCDCAADERSSEWDDGDWCVEVALNIPHEELVRLAERWEPEASSLPPGFRRATCVKCAEPMVAMWHVWYDHTFDDGRRFIKELHLCWSCGLEYV